MSIEQNRINPLASVKDYIYHLTLFSRNARLYLLGSFLVSLNFSIFQLLFNLYLKEQGFLEGDIGTILSGRAFGMAVMAIPAALLLSRIRLKPALLIATILFAVFSYSLVENENLRILQTSAVLAGMSFSIFRVASGPFFMRNSTLKERTYLFSASFATHILANMIGSSGAGNVVTFISERLDDLTIGYQYTLMIAIGLGILGLIPFTLIKAAKPSKEERKITITPEHLKRRWKFFAKISIANWLIGTGAGLIIPFLNLYFRDRFNATPEEIGYYFFAVSCSMFIGTLSGPVLAKRYGLIRTVVLTQLLSIPFMFILAYSYFLPLVVLAFVFRGGLMNMGVPISNNFGMEMSEKSEQGLVNALLTVSWTGGLTVAASIGGTVIENYGYTVVLNLTIILYVLSSIVYYAMFRKSETKGADNRWTVTGQNSI